MGTLTLSLLFFCKLKTVLKNSLLKKIRQSLGLERAEGGIINSVDVNLSKRSEMRKDKGAWRAVVHGVAKSRARLSD